LHPETKLLMTRMIEDAAYDEAFARLLQSFVAEKERERSSWARITVSAHYMLGGKSPQIERMAAVTETVLLALDLMDDLQDQDQSDKPWMRCPAPVALNALLALLMGVVAEFGELQVQGRALAQASRIVARSINGQQADVTDTIASVDDYLRMTQEKSGSLFRFACFMGYVDVNAADDAIAILHELADCIGLIQQIQNDMRDIVRVDEKNDLLGKKRTLPALYLLSIDDPAFRPIQEYYAGAIPKEALLQQKEAIIRMIRDSGCLEYSRVVQSVCLQKAERLYAQLPAVSPWKEAFRELTFASYLSGS